MDNNREKYTNLLSPNIIDQIVRGLTELAETTLWGKASKQTILALNDIKNWFREIPEHYKSKVMFGAVSKIETPSGMRVYQGVFDKKMRCFLVQQLLVEDLSKDLSELFGHKDVIIFIEDPKAFQRYVGA